MDIDDRVTALENRLRAAEDHLDILNLLNSYGPLIDSGDSAGAVSLWIQGGGYVFSGGAVDGSRLEAPTDLISAYETDYHQELIRRGSAHLTATPAVHIDGDDAEALAYSLVICREGESWVLRRAAINHWILRRTTVGWRVVEKVNELLTGSRASQDLLRRVPRGLGKGDHDTQPPDSVNVAWS